MDHPHTQSPIVKRDVERHIQNIQNQLKVLTRIYPDCETNAQIVASLLSTAACIRLQHMVNHEARPSDADLADTMEAMIDVLSQAWVVAVPVAIKYGPEKPFDSKELLKKIFELIDSVSKEGKDLNANLDALFGAPRQKDMH